jgi:purine-nucleoside phosphorylase
MFGISFTGQLKDLRDFPSFNQEVIDLIRSNLAAKTLLVIDTAWGLPSSGGFLVKDHINLTGNSPLLGPNNACGERFVKMTDLYVSNSDNLEHVVVAGLKSGIVPNAAELAVLKNLGASSWSYNLVPTSIIAAHAGLKVLGMLFSDDISLADLPKMKMSPILM